MTNHNIDKNREERTGFPEVIYGESKNLDDLLAILEQYKKHGKNALVTRLQVQKAAELQRVFQDSFFDEVSGIFFLRDIQPDSIANNHEVAILSGGTSDIAVVNEIFYTLQFLGFSAKPFSDIGVAGVHRLLGKVEELQKYKVLIVVAGFEGALPTVVGGLLPQPIIGVPTDVGYGVAKGGHVALKSMLSSCANGITVLNINNGYGAAMAAIRILNLVGTADHDA
ncbi:MAG: nickel pincer cofactor biosynthesis protein LarB [Thermodesulfobacteriota bacterium]